jgi:FkbM family methyltransferase
VPFSQLLKFFFDTSYATKAKKKLKKISKENDFYKIYFDDIDKPLYFPFEFGLKSLEQIIVESFYPDNWHYYELPQTKVEVADVVVDCGAAEGLFSLLVFQRCKRIYLIEPHPMFIQSLQKTFGKSNNVELLQYALSKNEFIAHLTSCGISSKLSSEIDEIEAKVTTLDKLFFEKNIPVSYLKIDLEGHDYDALLGAEKLISQNKPKIAVTTYHHIEHSIWMKDFIRSIDPSYKIKVKGIYQGSGSPVMLHAWV